MQLDVQALSAEHVAAQLASTPPSYFRKIGSKCGRHRCQRSVGREVSRWDNHS